VGGWLTGWLSAEKREKHEKQEKQEKQERCVGGWLAGWLAVWLCARLGVSEWVDC